MHLLKTELKTWLILKQSIEAVPNGKIPSFGKYMNEKYAFKNDNLSNEADHNVALLSIMRDHVQEIN